VRELERERDRLQPVSSELDEEEETEVVPQLRVDGVVVQEVPEVVQDAAVKTVENVRGVPRDQRRAALSELARRRERARPARRLCSGPSAVLLAAGASPSS
jgi:hypothetical protein